MLEHYAASLCSHPYLINSRLSLGKGHYSYEVQEAGLATIPEYEDMEAIPAPPSLHAVNLNPTKREAFCDCNYKPDPGVMDCCRHIAIAILEYHSIDLRAIQAYHRRSQLNAPLDINKLTRPSARIIAYRLRALAARTNYHRKLGLIWKFSDGELCRLLALARELNAGVRQA